MEITYLGHSSFRLRGKNATVICDPFDSKMVGLSFPKRLTGDIVTVSHSHGDHNFVSGIDGEPLVLSDSGEYEVKGVEIIGIPTFHDDSQGSQRGSNVVFKITIEGITVAHLGDLGHKLTDSQLEQLNSCDILLVPVGGFYTIDAHTAHAVMQQIEPKITIPMHYQRDGLTDAIKSKLTPVTAFLKEAGKEEITPEPKLIVKRGALPEEPKIVVLSD